jgi:hypothetical protein
MKMKIKMKMKMKMVITETHMKKQLKVDENNYIYSGMVHMNQSACSLTVGWKAAVVRRVLIWNKL